MTTFFVTGGAGFVGSTLCEKIIEENKKNKLIILDKLSYSGNVKYLKSILHLKRVKFIKNDLLNTKSYIKFLNKTDIAINVAAESHVDNSFNAPIEFTKNNTLGTHIFLENCMSANVKKIIHVSSDEVYGEKLKGEYFEKDPLFPTNPYSASKAAAELIINSYKFSYKKKVITVRGNNIFGIRQYPEKLISRSIVNLIKNKPIEIHGSGKNLRTYISVSDFSNAIIFLAKKVNDGIFNVGTKQEYQNIYIAKMICSLFNLPEIKYIKFVEDRLYNDFRYSVNCNKLKSLGWKPKDDLLKELPKIVEWYKHNYKIFKKNKNVKN